MTIGVSTCKTTASAQEVSRFLLDHLLEEMVVISPEGEGVGVCGYDELIAACGKEDLAHTPVDEIMREGVPEIPADIPIFAAAHWMRDMHIRVAYLMHQAAGISYPAAYISYQHILRVLAAQKEEELKDLGIHANRTLPLEAFKQKRDAARPKTFQR